MTYFRGHSILFPDATQPGHETVVQGHWLLRLAILYSDYINLQYPNSTDRLHYEFEKHILFSKTEFNQIPRKDIWLGFRFDLNTTWHMWYKASAAVLPRTLLLTTKNSTYIMFMFTYSARGNFLAVNYIGNGYICRHFNAMHLVSYLLTIYFFKRGVCFPYWIVRILQLFNHR